MIVWSGYNNSAYFITGGRYNPATNSWTATSTVAPCPIGRRFHTAVWTGSEMIVWGGYNGSSLQDGGIYALPVIPAAPVAPIFTGVTCASLTVNWAAVMGATSYDVWRATGATCTGAARIATGVTTTSYNDTGLTPSTQYSYYIVAVNACGSSANGTCASSATGPPVLPATSAAPAVADPDACLPTGVTVTWSAASGATRYDLLVDGITTVPGVTSPYTYVPGDANSHTYAIRGDNLCGEGAWSAAMAGTDVALAPPSVGVLMIQKLKLGMDMLLSWTPLSDPALLDYYEVMRSLSPRGPFDTRVGIVSFSAGAAASPLGLNGLVVSIAGEPATAYYKVRAVKGVCAGPLD